MHSAAVGGACSAAVRRPCCAVLVRRHVAAPGRGLDPVGAHSFVVTPGKGSVKLPSSGFHRNLINVNV